MANKDYISKQEAVDKLWRRNHHEDYEDDVFDEILEIENEIKAMPGADVAPRSEVALEIIGEIWASHTPDIDGFFTMHECELINLKKKYVKE